MCVCCKYFYIHLIIFPSLSIIRNWHYRDCVFHSILCPIAVFYYACEVRWNTVLVGRVEPLPLYIELEKYGSVETLARTVDMID